MPEYRHRIGIVSQATCCRRSKEHNVDLGQAEECKHGIVYWNYKVIVWLKEM